MDKAKEWQLELLMEKLRSKTGQFKSFAETAKALRMSLLASICSCINCTTAWLCLWRAVMMAEIYKVFLNPFK
jgi:hypothetical protein